MNLQILKFYSYVRSQDSWSGCGMFIAGEEVWWDVTLFITYDPLETITY